jgi:hypothetical protein
MGYPLSRARIGAQAIMRILGLMWKSEDAD